MNGVSKITSEQNMMLITFPGTRYDIAALAGYLNEFAEAGIIVDMICQSAPRGSVVDFSFTTSYSYFADVMKTIAARKAASGIAPLISSGYSKVNLFGAEMVNSYGVAARALTALAEKQIETPLISTSEIDISLLVRQEDEDQALEALNAAFGL